MLEELPTMPEDFEITVHTQYLPERSSENHFVFVYFIRIENRGQETAQLLERHWLINDGEGRSIEVHGAGVVGEQPRFTPGSVFEYNSSVAVNSTPGVMRGTYTFALEGGERFEVPIPPFALRLPENLRELN